FETYMYNLKASYEDTLKDKLSEKDLEDLKASVEAGLEWLESNPAAEEEDVSAKHKEVEAVANPIIARTYTGKDGADGSFSHNAEGEDAGDAN
ncbi:hypothetical protein, partial [Salmonella sp. s39606]|uniref:hypothetical protein n=1 Tax=Salmonella sp. s39606 TaxID=3159643 RepID=UPI00397F7E0B